MLTAYSYTQLEREVINILMLMSMSIWIYIAQFHAKHLRCARCTSNSWTGSSLMCTEIHRCLQPVYAVRQAVNFRRSEPDREGSPTECATSIPQNNKVVQVGWSSMSTSDVGDRSAAVDQIHVPWCFVLQSPTDNASQLVFHAFWNVEPVSLVVNQLWQTAVVLASVGD